MKVWPKLVCCCQNLPNALMKVLMIVTCFEVQTQSNLNFILPWNDVLNIAMSTGGKVSFNFVSSSSSSFLSFFSLGIFFV